MYVNYSNSIIQQLKNSLTLGEIHKKINAIIPLAYMMRKVFFSL